MIDHPWVESQETAEHLGDRAPFVDEAAQLSLFLRVELRDQRIGERRLHCRIRMPKILQEWVGIDCLAAIATPLGLLQSTCGPWAHQSLVQGEQKRLDQALLDLPNLLE